MDHTSDPLRTSASRPDLTGTVLGRLQIVARLGAGGMGEVYRAEDPKLRRTVAVKRVSAGATGNPIEAARLLNEGQRLSALNNPNIASVYDVLEQDGEVFLVMEYVEGQTLRQRLLQPIHVHEFFEIAIQCADALTAAHERGILHGDIKPENVMLTASGQVKLLDFGVARRLTAGNPDSSPDATQTVTALNTVGGTPSYMAPEVLMGSAPDFRADIFSLGVLFYEMLGGRHPFLGSTAAVTTMQIIQQEPPPLEKLSHSVPPPLILMVGKALQKKPDERYQSPRELAADLRAVRLGSKPAITVSHGVLGKQNWKLSLIGSIAAIVLLAGVYWIRHRETAPRDAGSARISTVKARPSVAVLGFKNLTERPDKAWLSTALAEMVSAELASGGQLRLISGEQVARANHDVPWIFGDMPKDSLSRLRANLDTDYVTTGSYAVVGEGEKSQIRIDFRVEDTNGGDTVARESATGSEADLFDLVSRIGAALRQDLHASPVTNEEASQVRAALPSNSEASRLYSEGLNKLRSFETLAARDLLTQAAAADPKSPQIHAALSAAWLDLGYDPKAKAEAKQAFDLSAGLSNEDKLWIEAQYRDLNSESKKAVELAHALVDLYPDNPDYGLRLVNLQNASGSPKDAMATLQTLRKLPPPAGEDPRIDLAEGPVAESLGDYKRELEVAAAAAKKGEARGNHLVQAQALLYQSTALNQLGDTERATEIMAQAKLLFAGSGDLKHSGMTLVWTAEFLLDKGDLPAARKQADEALVIFRQIGNQLYAGQALNEIGNILMHQGKLAEAKEQYELALKYYRDADYKVVIGDELANIGEVMERLGDLPGARKNLEEATQIFDEVGDKDAGGISEIKLGDVLEEQGDLPGAIEHLQRALKLENETGRKSAQAATLHALADVFTEEDDLKQARESNDKALAIRKDLKRASAIIASLIQSAEISTEEEKFADAEKSAADALHQLEAASSPAQLAEANATMAEILLAGKKQAEALAAAQKAITAAAKASDHNPKYDAALAMARVDIAAGKFADARRQIAPILAQPAKSASMPYLLEARLVQGEIGLKAGQTSGARTQLMSLEKDAREKKFLLIARKAGTLLR